MTMTQTNKGVLFTSNQNKIETTQREFEVLRLVASGKTIKEVAVELGIAVKTAEHHRTKLYKRLGVRSLVELTHFALAWMVVPNKFLTDAQHTAAA